MPLNIASLKALKHTAPENTARSPIGPQSWNVSDRRISRFHLVNKVRSSRKTRKGGNDRQHESLAGAGQMSRGSLASYRTRSASPWETFLTGTARHSPPLNLLRILLTLMMSIWDDCTCHRFRSHLVYILVSRLVAERNLLSKVLYLGSKWLAKSW